MAPAFMAIVGAINLAHPLLHAFEGGTLDALLVYLNATAVQMGPNVSLLWRRR